MSDKRSRRGAGLVREERGQTATEYLVLTGMMGALAIAMVNALYGPVRDALQRVARSILGVITGPP